MDPKDCAVVDVQADSEIIREVTVLNTKSENLAIGQLYLAEIKGRLSLIGHLEETLWRIVSIEEATQMYIKSRR